MASNDVALAPLQEVKRSSGIGGSEIAAVLGLSPWESAFDVWLTKTGRAPEKVENFAMWWGREIQSSIVKAYERQRGVLTVKLFDEPRRHPERPWQIGSPDALLPSDQTVIEAKAPGPRQAARYGDSGTDEIPDEHSLQVRWYLSLEDYEAGHLAVAFGSHDFRIYELQRDRELEDAMLTAAYKFWTEHVQADVPPEVKDTERTRDWLRKTFPQELVPLRRATEDETLLAAQYRAARKQQKHIEEIVGNLDIKIRAAIADAEGLEGDDFRFLYRKAKDAQKTDWKAAAHEMTLALNLIAETVEGPGQPDLRTIRAVAESGLAAIPVHTTTTAGSRRLLPKFDEEE